MCSILAALFLVVANITASFSIQFPPRPSERAFNVFGSPRSQSHSTPDNAVVIQSKPYNVSSNTTATEDNKIRRNLSIEKGDESDENLTEPKESPYAIDCGNDKACLEAHGLDSPEPTFKPYSQEELEKLLAQYTASQGNPPKVEDSPTNKLANLYMDDEEAVINVLENNSKDKDHEKSKSASWHLVQSQKHNHPYDDHKGWVTLEPVPWAQSQIQKWEPNAKPEIPSWDPPNHHRPTSHWDYKPPHDYSTERPWGKPSYDYKPSRPQWNQWTKPNDYPERPSSHWGENPDIITDSRPGYFPGPPPSQRPWYDQEPYSSNRPPQIYEDRPLYQQAHNSHHDHGHPSSHPSEGGGQWVLLSSTKGYSVPHRHKYQRSMTFDAKAPAASLSSHRTVRLTVLPADNSTNTTFSHDGLLEVESTLQTVEEAQREHAAKMLRLNTLKPEDVNPPVKTGRAKNSTTVPTASKANRRRSGESLQVFSAIPSKPENKAAMLAAIGAGMIPATMAMLLPMVLGRRRRSLADDQSVNLTNLEILQPKIRATRLQASF